MSSDTNAPDTRFTGNPKDTSGRPFDPSQQGFNKGLGRTVEIAGEQPIGTQHYNLTEAGKKQQSEEEKRQAEELRAPPSHAAVFQGGELKSRDAPGGEDWKSQEAAAQSGAQNL